MEDADVYINTGEGHGKINEVEQELKRERLTPSWQLGKYSWKIQEVINID